MDRWPPYGGGREGRFDCTYLFLSTKSYRDMIKLSYQLCIQNYDSNHNIKLLIFYLLTFRRDVILSITDFLSLPNVFRIAETFSLAWCWCFGYHDITGIISIGPMYVSICYTYLKLK